MLDTYRNSRYLTLPLKFSKENNFHINREGFVLSASVIDAVMLVPCCGCHTWYAGIAGPPACGQDKLVRSHQPLLSLLVDAAQRVRVHKLRVLIQIVDGLLAQCHPVAPVEAADVVLHFLHHLLPAVLVVLLVPQLPAVGGRILQPLAQQGGLISGSYVNLRIQRLKYRAGHAPMFPDQKIAKISCLRYCLVSLLS